MKKIWCRFAGLLIILSLIVSCTPRATPIPAIATTSAPVSAPSSLPTSQSPTSQDAAWDKIVAAAKKEGKATIYAFNYMGDVGIAITNAFEKRYGIKVEIITGRGAEFVERLKTEKRMGQMTADFMDSSAAFLFNAKIAGLTIPLSDLPVLQEKGVWDIEPKAMDPEAHVLAEYSFIYSPWINTRLLTPEQAPRSLKDLLKPEWKGKIIGHDPNVSSATYNYFVPLINAGVVDWEYVRAMGRQDIRLTPGPVQAVQMLSRGELSLILMSADSTGAPFVNEGASIRAISWSEGSVAVAGGISVIKDAPHPNAALVFANWILSEEGQKVFGEAAKYPMIRKGVDFRPVNARAPTTRLIVTTPKDIDDIARLIRERYIIELWKK